MTDFKPCPSCKKLNSTHLRQCAWCYHHLPTFGEKVAQWVIGIFSVLVIVSIIWMFR